HRFVSSSILIEIYQYHARILLKNKLFDQCLSIIQEMENKFDIEKKNLIPHLQLKAKCYLQMGDGKQAALYYQKCIQMGESRSFSFWNGLAKAYQLLNMTILYHACQQIASKLTNIKFHGTVNKKQEFQIIDWNCINLKDLLIDKESEEEMNFIKQYIINQERTKSKKEDETLSKFNALVL